MKNAKTILLYYPDPFGNSWDSKVWYELNNALCEIKEKK
jgi:hypothetical protein